MIQLGFVNHSTLAHLKPTHESPMSLHYAWESSHRCQPFHSLPANAAWRRHRYSSVHKQELVSWQALGDSRVKHVQARPRPHQALESGTASFYYPRFVETEVRRQVSSHIWNNASFIITQRRSNLCRDCNQSELRVYNLFCICVFPWRQFRYWSVAELAAAVENIKTLATHVQGKTWVPWNGTQKHSIPFQLVGQCSDERSGASLFDTFLQ